MSAVFMEFISRLAINENNSKYEIQRCKQSRIAPGYAPCRDWLTVAHGDIDPNDPGARANHESPITRSISWRYPALKQRGHVISEQLCLKHALC